MRRSAVALVAALALGAAPASGTAAERPASHEVGVLLVDHGEPPVYNEDTYESFRAFFEHLIEMGLIPSWVSLLDSGTVTQDVQCFSCDQPDPAAELMDAWLDPHAGPGVYVPASDSAPAHYAVPGGPGSGEPDVFEHVGLTAWHEWEVMGGRSPNYDQKLPKKLEVIERLRARYGRDLPIHIGYGIDPRINGERQDVRMALEALVEDGVDHVVVAYHGVGFSDIMQTHMLRHEIHEILDEIAPDVSVSYTKPMGTTDQYVKAIVTKARYEVSKLPRNAHVALHLSGHGLPTDMCGEYDCGEDAYHEVARGLFLRTKKAILKGVNHDGLGVFHIYGDGGSGDDDPNDEVDSPLEALSKREQDGYAYVVDIPYEFDSDSRDTLIILRQGYERPEGQWNKRYESRFKWNDIQVKITNSSFGAALKTDAYELVVADALDRALSRSPRKHHHT
jgi:hypothetical protein